MICFSIPKKKAVVVRNRDFFSKELFFVTCKNEQTKLNKAYPSTSGPYFKVVFE